MTGLLLINLGTPDAPTVPAVRRYLREFLYDPAVIDMNPVGRALLLELVILPFRPKKSAAAYAQIWGARGSPLLYHSQDLAAGVAATLGPTWKVALGMRYGSPTLASALGELADCDRVIVLPLYPQHANATTGSTLAAIDSLGGPPRVSIEDFFDDPAFIDPAARVARQHLAGFFAGSRPGDDEHVLFSFHGLPERQVKVVHPEHCLASAGCCDRVGAANRRCYRAQSFATARALAAALDLPEERWTVGFQSRLGRVPWIRPYTDEVVTELAAAGTRRLAVICPSFVADCLETLEEIGLRLGESFRDAGGEDFLAVPCVNADPDWIEGVARLAREAAQA